MLSLSESHRHQLFTLNIATSECLRHSGLGWVFSFRDWDTKRASLPSPGFVEVIMVSAPEKPHDCSSNPVLMPASKEQNARLRPQECVYRVQVQSRMTGLDHRPSAPSISKVPSTQETSAKRSAKLLSPDCSDPASRHFSLPFQTHLGAYVNKDTCKS